MVAAPFRIESSVVAGVRRLSVVGELDLATAPELARQLELAGSGAVEVDLSRVTFIDGSGLRVLLQARGRYHGDDLPGLELVGASRQVRRMFDLVGLAGHLADSGE